MTLNQIRQQFYRGQIVTVTNHYITRADHPCFGTQRRTIAKVTSSHLHFTESGSVSWPKAAQVTCENGVVQLFGGGLGQQPSDLFLTITPNAPTCPQCGAPMDVDRACVISEPVMQPRRDIDTHPRRTRIARAALCGGCEHCEEF